MATKKQERVYGLILENPRLSYYQAMIAAGYSHNTAIHPTKNLLGRSSWKEMRDKLLKAGAEVGLEPKTSMQVIKDAHHADKAIVMGTKSEESFVDIQPDHPTRLKAAEAHVKIMMADGTQKGKDDEEQPAGTVNIQNNFFDPNSPEVKKIIDAANKVMMKATEPDD